ncbi:crossover junction endonuclease EME1B-like [Solanum tuberosum]|uniref:crossover junction endonuclease EME1B-like n=1 Tax=Solanum tuberosum TaxID=4113 RepID=UPI0003D23EDE|nr:PREDICTED: crossover junction endonuclease EME1B-like [Solanum tuberosum]
MSQPISVDILSDDEDDGGNGGYGYSVKQNDTIDLSTPLTIPFKKKQRTEKSNNWNPTVLVIEDDDETPFRPSKSTPSFVADTPMSDLSKPEVSFVRCSLGSSSISDPKSSCLDLTPSMVAETPASELSKYSVPIVRCTKANAVSQNCSSSIIDHNKDGGIDGVICLESDNESENSGYHGTWKEEQKVCSTEAVVKETEWSSRPFGSTFSLGIDNFMRMPEDVSHRNSTEAGPSRDHDHPDEENDSLEPNDEVSRPKAKGKGNRSNKSSGDAATGKMRMSKEEQLRLKEEKRYQKEQEKLQKAAEKAEAAEQKKLEKEKQKWEKGKFAHKSIVAQIDTKVVELGSIGGHLLTRLAEKGLSYQIKSNPIERSIVWSMSVPEELSKISSEVIDVPYVLFIFEAEEFCNLVNSKSLLSHVSRVQRLYPLHTVCYLTNKLLAYINKREQGQYKDPANHTGWKRPLIEEVLSKLTINFVKVHSRHCVDEAELAEHVAGLTCSLASCQFRNKLTRLSVNANGSLIPKGCVDKNQIKKSPWLKALVAIPKVQPRFAIAIWNKYPTMKSLLRVYMDPSKSVHEKEFLLKDLKVEGMVSDDRRLGEICSKRVYRILMAQSGSSKTDDIECGADFFSQHSAE